MLARQVRIGRDEIDLVALDPGPPETLVAVEVRSATSGRFGAPEERLDARKVGRVYRGARALRATGTLPDESRLPLLPWRIDVVLVEMRPWLAPGIGGPLVRHLRGVRPD